MSVKDNKTYYLIDTIELEIECTFDIDDIMRHSENYITAKKYVQSNARRYKICTELQ